MDPIAASCGYRVSLEIRWQQAADTVFFSEDPRTASCGDRVFLGDPIAARSGYRVFLKDLIAASYGYRILP
eukprot:2607174-Karenia_brevis.AAC.1